MSGVPPLFWISRHRGQCLDLGMSLVQAESSRSPRRLQLSRAEQSSPEATLGPLQVLSLQCLQCSTALDVLKGPLCPKCCPLKRKLLHIKLQKGLEGGTGMESGTFCTKLPKKVPVQRSWQLLALREQHAAREGPGEQSRSEN